MKTRIFSAIAGAALLATSCLSMDLKPTAQGNSETWYTTEAELKMAVNEFYILGYWQEPFLSAEQWTDNFTYRNTNRGEGGSVLDATLTGQTWYVYNLWQQSYKLISRANSLLENIHRAEEAGMSQAMVDGFKAEAYFARACKYADLLFFYGDVPYIDRYYTITEAEQLQRTPLAEVKEHVYEDFDFAIEHLPVAHVPASSHFTKGAALAMKARFAMYMKDWKIMAESAKACMDLNVYRLEPDWAKLFLQTTRENDEKIFCIPRSITNSVVLDQWYVKNGLPRNAGGYAADTPSWDLLAAFLCTDGLPIDESPLFDPHNPFKNRDPRCCMTIVEFGSEHCGFIYDPSPVAKNVMNLTTGKEQANNDSRANQQYASFNGLIWKKGVDGSWLENGLNSDVDYLIMRYADVLLMYAEAKIELNEIDASVLEAINSVRARAYGVNVTMTTEYPAVTATDQATLRKTVRLERRVELAKECRRYMDLIRWDLAKKALNSYNYINLTDAAEWKTKVYDKGLYFWPETPQIDEDGLANFEPMAEAGLISRGAQRIFPERQMLWPIPTHDIDLSNGNLTQNPGY
ncbi:MAG: RagB/SusD family nutrient uptake outer membrane protein [Bacteroidales bacterium]|nr:RagB/SusD family nutrient uptake outer membrane protein [Bacteroidales bacterium]